MCAVTPKISCTTTMPPFGFRSGLARYAPMQWVPAVMMLMRSPMAVLRSCDHASVLRSLPVLLLSAAERRQGNEGVDAADAGGWELASYFFTSAWNTGWPRSGSHSGLALRSLQATGTVAQNFGSRSSAVAFWPSAT